MTDFRLTQTSLDQWSAGAPDMQVTTVFVEQWAQVNTSNPQFILTTVLVEQWASVAEAASSTAQARAWVMA